MRQTPTERLDLGLAIAELHARPGVPMTYREIASFTGGSWQNIYLIEKKGLRRLRNPSNLRRLRN